MNFAKRILTVTGLNAESQGDGYQHSALYVLLSALSALDDAHSVSDTYPNAVRELLEVRLASWKQNKWVQEFVGPYLNQFAPKLGAY
jgi:hypothetical protein